MRPGGSLGRGAAREVGVTWLLVKAGVIQPRLPGALAEVVAVDSGHDGVLMRDTFTARRLRWGGDILPAPGAYGSWDLVCAHEMLPRHRRWL